MDLVSVPLNKYSAKPNRTAGEQPEIIWQAISTIKYVTIINEYKLNIKLMLG